MVIRTSVRLGCFLVLAFLAGAACETLGPFFEVEISGLRAPTVPAGTKYLLLPGNDGVDQGDLQFMEFAAYVGRVLERKGLAPAVGGERPALVVLLSYGIGAPKVNTTSVPIIEQVSGGTKTVAVTTLTPAGPSTSYATVTEPVRLGVVGTKTRTETTYQRWAVVDAIDVASYLASGKISSAWKTVVTSTGSSGDLRTVFPVMIGAASELIGSNTTQQVVRRITENAPDVIYVRQAVIK
jgi:hypothetical protein